MNDSFYTIRNYRPTDFNSYLLLNIEAAKLEPTGQGTSPQLLSEHLNRPNYSPEQDLFIVETAGNTVGYLDILPEIKIGRVILNCFIHPEHRRRGLASKLLGYALSRAEELRVKVAHVNISQNNAAAKSLLSGLGFRFIRRFLQLRLDITKVRWQDFDQAVFQCRHLQRGEEEKLTQIQARSFAGAWGYNPNTVAEIIYQINLSNCSPDDVIVVYGGDKVVGYCWTGVNREAASGEEEGRIYMLGVDPDYRGRGIGRVALLAGLSHLQHKGFQVAELTVDSGNRAACALYRAVGFRVRTSSLWYEKVIGQGHRVK